jgi:hypothetical protein
VIATPHNDRACLDAITETVVEMIEAGDATILAIASQHRSPHGVASWIRSLPQRDDMGRPCDGPRVAECHPPQRLRIPADDPNCVERAALYIAAAELLDPAPIRRLATVETASGPHTFPTEDGEPVILDPMQSRNALRAGVFRANRARNGNAPIALTPAEAVDWVAELAAEPALRFVGGSHRVQNGHRAVRAVFVGRPLCIADVRDVGFMLALAAREAGLYGPTGHKVVETTARAVDNLDRLAAQHWMSRTAPRNAFELRVGGLRIKPDMKLLSSLGRVGGRIGAQVGLEALRVKLAAMGITGPLMQSVEQELKKEGLSLGPLSKPSPIGSLASLTPQGLGGHWLARKI